MMTFDEEPKNYKEAKMNKNWFDVMKALAQIRYGSIACSDPDGDNLECCPSTLECCSSCPTLYLTRASYLHEQSYSTQNRISTPSSYVTLPRKNCTCKATLKEANSKIEAVEKVKVKPSEFSSELELSSLTAISLLDGRYRNKVEDLTHYLSEYGLIYYRTLVEIPQASEVPSFSNESQKKLQELIDGFSNGDARQVKNIERITNHDVKAVEHFLKTKCQEDPQIAKVLEFFHFGCTSEDINNLAHGLMLKESLNLVILPGMAKANAHIPMLSRTHGQPASPTTLGKEMVIFQKVEILEKFARAVVNYNAHVVAYNDVTQIESHDYMAKLFHSFIRFNNILLDFDKDIWGYISVGYFKQVNEAALNKDLDNSWEVLAEPIQTVMRRYGVEEPYEKLKELMRGRVVNEERITEFLKKKGWKYRLKQK
ncbi:unnamed protein product [Lactuca saligna]|uniref:Adenylosuccinate lyase n=1 Tax=Lactuca saligna TaxID=75948 RepID=A0AA35ZKP1_LACSI|nr:unnamed protein product [Lactuca saligna]